MRILQVHNYYQQGGGEDVVAAAERELLQVRGHDVSFYSISNNAVKGVIKKIQTAWQAHYSKNERKRLALEIVSFRPDIVHVHNWFPLLTPSIFDACRQFDVPVVQSLHNYRTICANALFMRKGKTCELCIAKTPFNAVINHCYKDSYLGSWAVARMIRYHKNHHTWINKVDCFITLTEFAKNKFIECGFPTQKIYVKPNFVIDKEDMFKCRDRQSGGLFVGRLTDEKGLKILFEAWHDLDAPLRIVGDGHLRSWIESHRISSIKVLGQLDSYHAFAEMASAEYLIVPSIWYEGFPMVVVEAFSRGLPVIASRIGSLPEIVKDGETGLLFEAGNPADLRNKIIWASNNKEIMTKMGRQARRTYEEKYSPKVNYLMLMSVYEQARKHKVKKNLD